MSCLILIYRQSTCGRYPRPTRCLSRKWLRKTTSKNWLLDFLNRGELPPVNVYQKQPNFCATKDLLERYLQHSQNSGSRRRATETAFGMFIHKALPSTKRINSTVIGFDEGHHAI